MDGRADDGGSAIVEFVLLAVVMIVPFAYAVLTVFEVERAAFAVAAASREAGRAFVTAADGASGQARARAAADLVLADHGVPTATAADIDCAVDPCLTPGARVTVRLETSVPLPFVPHWGHGGPASITVRARHAEVVDTYREVRP